MKIDKSRTYQYVKLVNNGRRLYCLQQNLAVLAWILFIKKDSLYPILRFRPNTKGLSNWLLNRFWYNNKLFKINSNILISFVLRKFHLRRNGNNDHIVELPKKGQLCISAHKGYKVFDIYKGKVTKIFNHDVNISDISREIEGLKKALQIDFAPSIRKWNIEERWYEEDYISGSLDAGIQRDSATLLNKFYLDIAPCLKSLILLKPPIAKNSVEYIHEIIEILKVSRLSRQASTAREFHKIKSFIDSMVGRLDALGDYPNFLVFTHGDFVPANMLNTRQGIRVIDWEGAAYRSSLFDFYSYFFLRIVFWKFSVHQVASEINTALSFLVSKVAEKAPDISNSLLHFEKVYRWIYYIELVCKEVEREMTDTNLNILEGILQHIDAFNQYEEITNMGKPLKKSI